MKLSPEDISVIAGEVITDFNDTLALKVRSKHGGDEEAIYDQLADRGELEDAIVTVLATLDI